MPIIVLKQLYIKTKIYCLQNGTGINCPNEDGVPSVKEILVNGDIKVIEIIREINANV